MNAADVLAMSDDLPDVVINHHTNWSAITVAGKGFCWVSHADDIAMVKSTHDEQAALMAIDPATYSQGRTTATSAWLTIRLPGVDPDDLRDLLAEGWRMTAPKPAVAAYDAVHGLA